MITARAAVRLIAAVGHFAVEHANPKAFLTVRLQTTAPKKYNGRLGKYKRNITKLANQFGGFKIDNDLEWSYNFFATQESAQTFQKALNIYFGNEDVGDNVEDTRPVQAD